MEASSDGNNKELVVGSDGAIYCMVRPPVPVYDVDNQRMENGGRLLTSRKMNGQTQMASGPLGMNMHPMSALTGTSGLAGAQGLGGGHGFVDSSTLGMRNAITVNSMGNLPSSYQVAQAMQPTVQHQMGLMPDVSLSSTGVSNIMARNNQIIYDSSLQGGLASVQCQNSILSRTRHRADDRLESNAKRIRLFPLQGSSVLQGNQIIQNIPTLQRVQTIRGLPSIQGVPGFQGIQNIQGIQNLQKVHRSAQHTQPVQFVRSRVAGRSFPLYIDSDEFNLSHFQRLARKQMEIFEATEQDAGTSAQGRNKPITPGQVGIRCKHCATLPPKQRKTGAVYYPNRLDGVYQTAQKMIVGHLFKVCHMLPDETRRKMLFFKDQKSSDGGGKRYWADGARSLGVIETPSDGLIFAPIA